MKGKFPNPLAGIMKRVGVGPTELARLAKTSKQNVDRHAKGQRELTVSWAKKYAPHLGVTVEELAVGPQPKPKVARGTGKTISVPLLASVPAGRAWASEGVTLSNVRKTLIVGGLPAQGDWIALEVAGDSMDRVARDGAIIFVDRADKRLMRDRFYVFSTDAGESTFKRYRPGPPDRMVPYSTNPDHETDPLDDRYFVVGRVRRVMLDL